ncbi:DnaD domain-containing protein [Loigolactobacillus backii]|uniref:DnaD domain-containing protein n=1 Tax=Loigolactobacillus backii TaxID=375175 RepID=UPI0022FDA11E|nr:DnaD domain protein [Loigolactobacillus backii]MDA5386496.1 DnaD domain protein [Loigolactobacillus backii]MDA5389023.1 DnaD domain protein [Loigolactobacillus backii]
MAKGGWWATYRKIEDSIVWTNSDWLKMWILCLNHAAFTDQATQRLNGKEIKVHNGQWAASRATIARIFNAGCKPAQRITKDSAWRIILKLKQFGMLHIDSSPEYSVITVVNWGTYQKSAQQTANESPTNRQQNDNLLNKGNNGNNAKASTTTAKSENPFEFFQENGFGQISGYVGEDINGWVKDFVEIGATTDEANSILVKALKITADRGKNSWGYAKGILKDWEQHKLNSIESIEAEQNKFQANSRNNKSRSSTTDVYRDHEITDDDLPF